MNKENERITYEEFMTMFKFAPRMCYILYDKAEDEIENLQKKAELGEHYKHLYSEVKKQKDDAIKFIHKELDRFDCEGSMSISMMISYFEEELLRMLGEIDVKD